MTREAWDKLNAERQRLAHDGGDFVPRDDEDAAGDLVRLLELPARQAARRLDRLTAVLDRSEVVAAPGVVAIGRRVTLREDDGSTATYLVVAPGEGDPGEGWISADCPLGVAVVGQQTGVSVQINAPAGNRSVLIEAVT